MRQRHGRSKLPTAREFENNNLWNVLLRIPWTARRNNVSILRELKVENVQRLSLAWLQDIIRCFGHVPCRDGNIMEHWWCQGKWEEEITNGGRIRSSNNWSYLSMLHSIRRLNTTNGDCRSTEWTGVAILNEEKKKIKSILIPFLRII